MRMNWVTGESCCVVWCALLLTCVNTQTYSDVNRVFVDRLGTNSSYNTAVRPVLDHTQVLNVTIECSLIAIVEMDDKTQKFVVNGFLAMIWKDEMVSWDPTLYNNVNTIYPAPKQVWRPRTVLMNTLEDRDLFEDDYSPVSVSHDGMVQWFPGSLFPTSCKLNLRKYPFDTQECYIWMFTMAYPSAEVTYQTSRDDVGLDFFVQSGEWQIASSSVTVGDNFGLAFFRITFILERRPGFFIINIVMPVVLLSFLNIMVFLIPVESGEKISYGITVLLALAVFMSIVGDMLPRSSDIIPLVTIYLIILLIISVLTVIVAIGIVWLHHKEEEECRRQKAAASFKNMFGKVRVMNRAAGNLIKVMPSKDPESGDTESGQPSPLMEGLKKMREAEKVPEKGPTVEVKEESCPKVNRYKMIGKHINRVSFVLFMILWCLITLVFVITITV